MPKQKQKQRLRLRLRQKLKLNPKHMHMVFNSQHLLVTKDTITDMDVVDRAPQLSLSTKLSSLPRLSERQGPPLRLASRQAHHPRLRLHRPLLPPPMLGLVTLTTTLPAARTPISSG